MKLIYRDMGHILDFNEGYAVELVIEDPRLFRSFVYSLSEQIDGGRGDAVLSSDGKPIELSKYADITVQFSPFLLNRKNLLTKLYSSLEQQAMNSDNYIDTVERLSSLEAYIHKLAEEFPFQIDCKKVAIGPLIKALSPEIAEADSSDIDRIFSYMELVRELDRDKLFIMVNMRAYFSDGEMESFTQSACLHDFKLLLIEGIARNPLTNAKRYTVDADLCEF